MTVDLKHKPVLLNQTCKQLPTSLPSSYVHTQSTSRPSSYANHFTCCPFWRLNRLAMKQLLVTLLLFLGCVSVIRAQVRKESFAIDVEMEMDMNNNENRENPDFQSLINEEFVSLIFCVTFNHGWVMPSEKFKNTYRIVNYRGFYATYNNF